MTIRESAYQLCKTISKLLARERVKDIVASINQRPEGQAGGRTDRSSFGYLARQLNAQFLGYLVVDRDKPQLSERYPPLRWSDTLNEEERLILAGAHKSIVGLNKSCADPFTRILPNAYAAIDPYSRFGYEPPEIAPEMEFLPPEAIEAMALNFHQHPSLEIIAEIAQRYSAVISEKIPIEKLAQSVIELEQMVLKSGPLHAPRILDILGIHREDSPQVVVLRYLSALTCLRESLAVLDELVYLAFLTERLPIISESNTVKVGTFNTHFAGEGLSLTCQPDEKFRGFETGLTLVKCSHLREPFPHDLCRVEALNFQASNDYGDVVDIQLRVINEDLNPFIGLLRRS